MGQPGRFGRYTVVREIGRGGFATVWLARDEELDADVAVKVLAEHWVNNLEVRHRFVEEGRFLRRVTSPYVVTVHDIGETSDQRPYLVLSYADRGTLADRLETGPLDLPAVVTMAEQVGTGLRALHDRGLLHRDVKPANVLFRDSPSGPQAMVGDLGLGKSLEAISQLTLPGGTPAYVSPEQVRGRHLDRRADLYSLAAVCYAALTGRPPYGSETLAAVLDITGPPEPMRKHRPEIPAAVDDVVLRGLELDPADRWPDIAAFTTALAAAAVPEPPRRSRRIWLAGVVVLLAGLGVFAGVRIGLDRQWVEVRDASGTVSVRMPRAWTGEVAGAGWRPSGGTTPSPALLVSSDNARWAEPFAGVTGVFVGVLPAGHPADTLGPPPGCASGRTDSEPGKITSVYLNCPGGLTTYERRLVDGDCLLRIQVRRPPADEDRSRRVLDSVRCLR